MGPPLPHHATTCATANRMTPLQQAAFLTGLLATAAAPHRRRGTCANTAEEERRSPALTQI